MVGDWSLGTPDGPLISQTEIQKNSQNLDMIAAGDTVLIHGKIKDTLDNRFRYYWSFPEGEKYRSMEWYVD